MCSDTSFNSTIKMISDNSHDVNEESCYLLTPITKSQGCHSLLVLPTPQYDYACFVFNSCISELFLKIIFCVITDKIIFLNICNVLVFLLVSVW